MKVSISSITRARKVLGYGDPEVVQQVTAGKLSVTKAAAIGKGKAKTNNNNDAEAEAEAPPSSAELTALDEYDSLEEKLLAKLGDLSAGKAEEHSDMTINKIKKQVGIMKKAAAKAA
jgi:hypothetical protein